jgi:hypothetical protein
MAPKKPPRSLERGVELIEKDVAERLDAFFELTRKSTAANQTGALVRARRSASDPMAPIAIARRAKVRPGVLTALRRGQASNVAEVHAVADAIEVPRRHFWNRLRAQAVKFLRSLEDGKRVA